MKKKNILMKKKLLTLFLIFSAFHSFAQWSPSSPGDENVNAKPIYVHGTLANGLYIGRGTNNIADNVAIGNLNSAIILPPLAGSGGECVGIGTGVLNVTTNTGTHNVGVGYLSLRNNNGDGGNSGCFNTAVGSGSMSANTTGIRNTAVGMSSLSANTVGANNVAIGWSALSGLNNTDPALSSENTAVGVTAMSGLQTGIGNVAIGKNAGVYQPAGGVFTTGNYNVALGAGAYLSNGSYQLSIQSCINGVNMGNAGIGSGYIGIGVVPTATAISGLWPRLHVAGNSVRPSLQLDFVPTYSGTAPVTNPVGSGKYLFVDAEGIVSQASLPAGVGSPTHTFTNPVNTITSEVGGIVRTALAVNSVENVIAGNTIVTKVNGVPSPAITLPSNSNLNIYNSDGTLTASRTVTMTDQNLWFKTGTDFNGSTGRIYIGATPSYPTSVPGNNYRLYVEGGILTEKIKVAVRTTSNWADYVFADNYALMPIKELASFVKTKKHLPGINAVDELVKEGLDLGAMQARQMAKIEELTLYIIDQHNRMEKQNEEIETLKAQVKILLERHK